MLFVTTYNINEIINIFNYLVNINIIIYILYMTIKLLWQHPIYYNCIIFVKYYQKIYTWQLSNNEDIIELDESFLIEKEFKENTFVYTKYSCKEKKMLWNLMQEEW